MMMFSGSLNPLAFASALSVSPFSPGLSSALTIAPMPASHLATSSPGNALPHLISIKKFCLHNNISDSDHLKLVTLEVCLSDHSGEAGTIILEGGWVVKACLGPLSCCT